MPEVDDYLAGLEPPVAAAFRAVVTVATELAPDAEQGTSYGMAALRHKGKPLLGFRLAAKHLAVFPFSPQAVEAAAAELDGFDVSKGTVRFTVDRPLPASAVRALVRARIAEIEG